MFYNNKILTPIILIIFIGITSVFLNIITNTESKDSIKFGSYEYNLTYDKNNRKIVEVKLGSTYKKTKETDKNTKYLDEYLSY